MGNAGGGGMIKKFNVEVVMWNNLATWFCSLNSRHRMRLCVAAYERMGAQIPKSYPRGLEVECLLLPGWMIADFFGLPRRSPLSHA